MKRYNLSSSFLGVVLSAKIAFSQRSWPYLAACAVPWLLCAGQRCVTRLAGLSQHRRSLRKKSPRRRVSCLKREIRPVISWKNQCWSMDFMSDQLYDGRRIRLLTIVDNHTRESLAIHVGQRIRGIDVVRVLEAVRGEHALPRVIRVDNGRRQPGKLNGSGMLSIGPRSFAWCGNMP